MKRPILFGTIVVFATGIGVLILPSGKVAAQSTSPPYNPYPSGILPSDLTAEIARVRR